MKFKKIMTALLAAAMLSSFTAGCGSSATIDTTAVVAVLDDKEIPLGVANFMAQCQAVQYDAYLLSYYGESMWSSDAGDGSTMTESVKSSIMDTLEEYYLLDAHMGDYGVTITDEDMAKISQAAEQFLSDNTAAAAKTMGADQASVEEMLRLYAVHSKMYNAIIDTIDTNVSEEEMAQKTFSYVKIDSSSIASEDDSTGEETEAADEAESEETGEETGSEETESEETESEEDTAAQVQAAAEQFLDALQDGTLEERAEEEGYTVSTCSYGPADLNEDENSTGLDISILEAAEKLSDGSLLSELLTVDDAYYIIRMDNTDDKEAAETKKESILEERRSSLYEEVLQGYKDACTWTVKEDVWAEVNFDNLYTIAASEEESTEESTEEATEESTEESTEEATEESTDAQ